MDNVNTIEDQKFYLSGVFLEGLQSFQTNWTFPDEDAIALGFSSPVGDFHQGNLEGEVTLERLVVTSGDPLTGFFEGGISGHLTYGDEKGYIFNQGYISNYSCECSVDELPQLTTTLRTFGEMLGASGTSVIQPGPETTPNNQIFLPSQGDIEIEITNFNNSDPVIDTKTDAVQSFEYDINIEWEPVYGLGSNDPQAYINKPPVVEAVITISLNENVSPDFKTQACSPTLKNLTLKMLNCKDRCSGEKEVIRSFEIPCARLISYTNISSDLGVLLGEFVFRSTGRPISELGGLVDGT